MYSESKRLQCPTPIASAALQQFISGASLGLTRKDDSQVVKVYETLTGVPLVTEGAKCKATSKKEGDEVGDLWDGEEILEVGDEPRHKLALANDYTRVLKVKFEPNDTTLAHRHAEDSLYFFLVEDGLNVINHVKGFDPQCDCMVSEIAQSVVVFTSHYTVWVRVFLKIIVCLSLQFFFLYFKGIW